MIRDAERLVEEIKLLKAQYFRFLDTKDYDGLDAIFTDDAVIDVRGSTTASNDTEPSVGGLDDGLMTGLGLKKFFRTSIADLVTVHHGHMPEITLLSETTATAVWAMEDRIWFKPGSPSRMMHGWGHYHESYVRADHAWRISAMRISRIRTELFGWT
jgi:hypothetical protein